MLFLRKEEDTLERGRKDEIIIIMSTNGVSPGEN